MYAVEILRDVAHTLKRNGESYIRNQRLTSLKSEKFASELQSISNRANSSGIDIGKHRKEQEKFRFVERRFTHQQFLERGVGLFERNEQRVRKLSR